MLQDKEKHINNNEAYTDGSKSSKCSLDSTKLEAFHTHRWNASNKKSSEINQQ